MIEIGKIDFMDFVEEAAESIVNIKGKKKKFSKCIVYIGDNEGNIPHFHVSSEDYKEFLCCIYIYDNRYFTHGKHKDEFENGHQRKILDKWLRQQSKYADNYSNWQYLKLMWNQYNPIHAVPDTIDRQYQPNYTYIKSYKS